MQEKFEEVIEVIRKEEEKKKKRWSFDVTNEFKIECYPEHTWNSLP
jgi:hypothetical protein